MLAAVLLGIGAAGAALAAPGRAGRAESNSSASPAVTPAVSLVMQGGGIYDVDLAQPRPKPQYRVQANQSVVPQMDINFQALLLAPDVFADPAEDPIWRIHPTSSARLIQSPLVLTPGEEPYVLQTNSIHIKGGHVIAFRFSDLPAIGPLVDQSENSDLVTAIDGPPLVTKSVTVYPDGTMRWKLERITGGDIKSVPRLYAFKPCAASFCKECFPPHCPISGSKAGRPKPP